MKNTLLFAALVAAVSAPPVPVLAQEPGSATVVPVSVNGDPAARFALVVMSDGYTAEEMSKYRAHLDKHLNVLWSIEPFRSYRNYINVYSVEIVSADSGITCDPEVRQKKTTPLGANFTGGCENPNARGILVNQAVAREYAQRATPHFDQILVITNTDTYGGIGGAVATTSGGNSLGPLITPHELGHSLGRLQDEYTYRERGVPGGTYSGREPTSIHHTLLTEEQMRAQQAKWFRWLGDVSESGGSIGRFEGGQYMREGIWRPSKHSMMISVGYYFDQVSRERMVQRISEQVNLIAASTPVEQPVPRGGVLWIETAHPNFHELDVAWRVDDREIPEARNRRSLDLKPWPGAGKVSVTVVDPTEFVRDPAIRAGALTMTRAWRIDNTMPTVKYTLSTPVATDTKDGLPHFTFEEEFTMKLEPSDDQPGYVVAEFRVNGDGWHHYYGWPDAPEGTPYKFTPRGTNIKELIYGSLSSEGLSPQPWEARKPGYGTHRIEVRAIDAAGNIGPVTAFRVTVRPAAR